VTKPLHGEPMQQWLSAVGCCQCGHKTCSLQACLAHSHPNIRDRHWVRDKACVHGIKAMVECTPQLYVQAHGDLAAPAGRQC
jgi:hypothetical protein